MYSYSVKKDNYPKFTAPWPDKEKSNFDKSGIWAKKYEYEPNHPWSFWKQQTF